MNTMDTCYDFDGWLIRLPQTWKMSLDEKAQPPQAIFESDGASITMYISTWRFQRPETGEPAGAEDVLSIALQAFAQKGLSPLDGFSAYGPEGFLTCMGKGLTDDGCLILACFICAVGAALSVYIVCDNDADFEKCLPYIRSVERT
ncbi:MAG: hypothetical protein HFG01_00670 [Oscillibacter sp.]|nr:hypothetical protein [Oscillibacter sp.]